MMILPCRIPGSENPSLSPGNPQTQLIHAGLAQDLGPSEGNAAVPKAQCARLESGIGNQENVHWRHGSTAEEFSAPNKKI